MNSSWFAPETTCNGVRLAFVNKHRFHRKEAKCAMKPVDKDK